MPTPRLDVRLKLLAGDGSRRLTSWAPLHVHLGTGHHVAHVVPLDSNELSPGESARVQLVFDKPICATPGDRFIVRDAQAIHTVGGGVVLDPAAPSRKRRSAERLRWLDALERLVAGEGVTHLLRDAPHGVKMSELARVMGLPPDEVVLPADAVIIDSGHERFILQPQHWLALRDRAIAALHQFHAQVPDEPGPDIGRLRRIALPDLSDALWRALIAALVDERLVILSGPWLHLPEHTVALSDEDQVLARKLQPLIAIGKFDPPWGPRPRRRFPVSPKSECAKYYASRSHKARCFKSCATSFTTATVSASLPRSSRGSHGSMAR